MIELKPRDVIAILTLIFGFILLAIKIDSVVGGILIVVIGWYFGKNKS